MRPRRVLLAFSALSWVAQLSCSTTPPAARDKPADVLSAPPAADKGLQLALKVKVDPGKEVVVCRELVIPGDAAIEVGKIDHASSPGTHHVHAYRTSTPPDKVSPGVFDCGDLAGPLLYTAQKEAESTRFQPGIGVKFAKGEVVRLELHYLNTGEAAADAELRLNLWFADAPLIAEAGSFFMYDHDIAVAPHAKATTRMHCEIPSDILITSLLPHVHAHGTGERIYLSGKGVNPPKLLIGSKGYGDLETRYFDDKPVVVKAGQALDFECDYQNDGPTGLLAGSSTTKAEMCMILGSYYPRLPAAAEWCTLAGSGPLHEGKTTCKDALKCATTKMDEGSFEQEACVIDVCKGSSSAYDDVNNCGDNRCPDRCPGKHCSECLDEKCQAELGACKAATCGP
jgi:hypothetical protein